MRKLGSAIRGMVAASALMLVASPALAGDEERARAAIAQAEGKIDAATRVGNDIDPAGLARAQASLRLAKEQLKSGKEQKAIASGIEAQQFADTVIGRAQQRADRAESALSAASSDASATRQATPVIVATTPAPAPTTTVTTTETVRTAAPAPRARTTAARQPVRKTTTAKRTTTAAARPTVTEKTTTIVTSSR